MAHTAVVTGATGFVASELVKQLLGKGYNVRATVRSLADPSRVDHLVTLGKALPGNLQFFEADLLTEGSFDAAVKGADYVFHVASPFQIQVADPQRDLIEPAVAGTTNLMSSVAQNKGTVKRVVVTSSVAAVHGGSGIAAPAQGGVYSEADFNSTSTVENGEAYWVSKTKAEQVAWEQAKQHGLDLVTVLPNFVLGPMVSTRVDGLSVGFIKGWLEGKASDGPALVCDVRDVAAAHVLAVENPAAKGRYIVSNAHAMSPKFISDTLKERFPGFAIPDGLDVTSTEKDINNSKVQAELGLSITPVKSTLVDMAVAAIQLGIAKPVELPH